MSRVRRLIRLPITRDVVINTSGNYINVLFTAVYALVLVRVLTPAEYGVLSVLFGVAYVLANILDFGITASIYSYLPPILENRQEKLKFVKSNFLFQTILAFTALLVIFIFIRDIDARFLKLDVPPSYFFWTFLSIPLFIWQNFILNVLYASKRFLHANVAVNVANVVKTLILLFIIWHGKVTIENIIITLGVVGPLLFMLLVFRNRRTLIGELIKVKAERSKIRLRYTLTFFFASQLFNLATRVDLFMLSFYLPKAQVGYYGLSQKIIIAVITSVNSITQVLSPQFSKIKKQTEVLSLLKKSFVYMLLPTAIFALAIVTPTSVYTMVFTKKFVQTAAITRALSAPYILFGFVAPPLLFFLYTIRKPMHLFYVNVLFLGIVAAGSYVLIPQYGVLGPPAAFFAAFSAVALYIAVAFWREVRRLEK